MRRIVSLLLILVICLGVFSGCHGAVERHVFEVPETFDTSKEYELVFWAKNESNVNQKNVYEQAIADFEALYPNIKVTMRHPGQSAALHAAFHHVGRSLLALPL